MAAPNVGQMIAEAWVAAVKRGDVGDPDAMIDLRMIEWPAKPYLPTPDEQAARDAADALWDAEYASGQAAESAAFLGTIVKAEKDGNGDLLTFADGRRLLIIADEYEWKKP